jgi:histidinol phosphatase-like enzyme (inositol monophosphatase family)
MLSLQRTTLLLEAAQEAARVAGWAALRRYRKALDVESKADGSPVTIADREAEAAVRAWIGRCFPDDGIEGEELGIVRPDASRRWLVDPIDGTRTFVRGVPLWGAVIAVVEHDQVLAGAAFFPAIDETIAAAPGEGTWWNGSRCSVSSVSQVERATVLTTDERFRSDDLKRADWRRLSERADVSRSWGDCYGYLLVATGRAEVMVDPVLAPWDAAAFMPIVEEAGGVFTDWSGTRTAFGGSAIATNAALAAETRALLRPSNP